MVIQRRPHCSATMAVVPEPQVGSSTRSPGSEVIKMQRWTTFVAVWTTYAFASENPLTIVSDQSDLTSEYPKSPKKIG